MKSYIPRSVRAFTLILFVLTLAACGSTSKLNRTASTLSLADYSTVYVADFNDKTPSTIKDAAKLAAYRDSVKAAGVTFADMIGTNVEKIVTPPSVLRAAPADGAKSSTDKVLRIEGEITTFQRGNALAKMLLPFAGSTKFNATVRFIDQSTGEKIGEIVVDKNSSPLGGGIAAIQTTNKFMSGAAEKVGEQLAIARNGNPK